jgi:hypothetical protein
MHPAESGEGRFGDEAGGLSLVVGRARVDYGIMRECGAGAPARGF